MARTSLQIIAESLAKRHGLTQKEAERFLATAFSVLHAGLDADKQVKVKGLGTFKVIAVKSRESVDVNTQERMVIAGHNKVTFTPDASMKELVNKPFSAYKTEVLHDGVDLGAIDRKYGIDTSEDPQIEPQSDAETVVEEPVQKEVPSEAPSAVEPTTPEEKVPASPLRVVEKPVSAPLSEQDEVPPTDGQTSEATPVSPQAADEKEEKVGVEQPVEVAAAKPESQPLSVVSQAEKPKTVSLNVQKAPEATTEDVDEPEGESEEAPEMSSRKRYLWIAVLGLLIVLAVVGYFFYNNWQAQQAPMPIARQVEKPRSAVQPAPRVADTLATKPQPVAVQPKNDTATIDFDKINKDPLVKHGAYRIVGVDTVIRLKKGQTMKKYRDHTLGSLMIVYFQALNGKETMGEGELMKVPKVEVKKRLRK